MLTASYLAHDAFLQNVTRITKCKSYFIGSGVLLRNATVITKCVNFIAKYDSYYKMRTGKVANTNYTKT